MPTARSRMKTVIRKVAHAVVHGLALVLLSMSQPAHASVVITPPPIAVEWQLVLTAYPCVVFTGETCTPFTALSATFALSGEEQGPLLTPSDVLEVKGEAQDITHKGHISALAGESLAFSLSGQYTPPPPAPGGPIPIPYPLFAFASGSPPGDDVPEIPPVIELGSLASASFDPVVLTGPLFAFDAPVQVGTWEIILRPAPAPATLALLGIGLAGLGLARRRKAH